MDDLPYIIIIIICICFSAFFSASETAYTSVNRIRLKTQAEDGNKRAKSVLDTLEKYDRFISTVLIGNNIVNITSASLATILFTRHIGESASWVSTIVMTIIVLICGEVCPKGLAKNHAEGIVKAVNPFIKVLIYIFLPLSVFLESLSKLVNKIFKKKSVDEQITEDELLTIIDEIEDEGMIKPYEKTLITSAIKFDDIDVKDIVTPRKDIVAIDVTMGVDEIHQLFEESKFTRLPVYRDSIDNIIGILHEKDFYSYLIKRENEEFRINELMKPPHFVSQETKISIVFKTFKDQHYHMAVVLDQFDSTLGIITLEDVIEELVGEIFDETDEIYEETKQIDDDNYLVSGKELLEDAFSIMNIEDEEEDLNQTINSWLSKKLSHLPTSGDNFIYQDRWKVFVNSANKKGAVEVSFKKL